MIPILSKNKAKSLKSLKDELFADVKSFRGSKPQHDDMTLIMMKKF
jgi:serine phosphatase RsbU (regulator of sigma subunit)